MKFKKSVFLGLLVLTVIVLPAFKNVRDFEFNPGENFVSCYKDQDKSSVAKTLDISNQELDSYFSEKNIEFLAVSYDKKSQIRISAYNDMLSKSARDISNLSEKNIKKLAQSITEDTALTYDIYIRNSRKYIEITENLKDSGGEFVSTQLITMANGKIFNITINNAGDFVDEDMLKSLDTLKFKESQDSFKSYIIITIAIVIGIGVFITLIVLMILGIIKDKKNEENV